jgi:CHAT domain-containing protein/TPR repeat protein
MERPDLQRVGTTGKLTMLACRSCTHSFERNDPLLLSRLSPAAPILLAVSEEEYGKLLLPQRANDQLSRLWKDLGDDRWDVPAPLIGLRLSLVSLVCSRVLTEDFIDVQGATKEIARTEGRWRAVQYRRFLEKLNETWPIRRIHRGLGRAIFIESEHDLREVIREFPELIDGGGLDHVRQSVEEEPDEVLRSHREATLRMLERAASADFRTAWDEYAKFMQAVWQSKVGSELDKLLPKIHVAIDSGIFDDDVVAACRSALALAEMSGDPELEAEMNHYLGQALCAVLGPGEGDRIEEGIQRYERALDLTKDADAKVDLALNLGAAYCGRAVGDPSWNLQRGIDHLQAVIEATSLEARPHKWAMAQTNLGLALANQANPESLRAAIQHLKAALKWRSFERNPLDWAYTQNNLGVVYARQRVGNRRESLSRAVSHYEKAARGFLGAGKPRLWAWSQRNLAHANLELADQNQDEKERSSRLEDAFSYARRAADAEGLADSGYEGSLTLDVLARVHAQLGNLPAAIGELQRALTLVTPLEFPRLVRGEAVFLASLCATEHRWEEAALAYRTALEAGALCYQERTTAEGRWNEIKADHNLARWAALVYAQVGWTEEAVATLESHRAREMAAVARRYDAQVEELQTIDPTLYEAFVTAGNRVDLAERQQREGIPPDLATSSEWSASSIEYRKVLTEIRRVPRFNDFLTDTSGSLVFEAPEPRRPLAYLVTGPEASVVFLVWNPADIAADDSDRPEPRVELVETREVTSMSVLPYLVNAITGDFSIQTGDTRTVEASLSDLSHTVGECLLRPLADRLRGRNAEGITFIPIALMGLVPLHALSWFEESAPKSLLDEFEVGYAASAELQLRCHQRLSKGAEPFLVSVANPMPSLTPLPGAEAEVGQVADHFNASRKVVLTGHEATAERLLGELPRATHLHLACHGYGDVYGSPLSAYLQLAEGERLTLATILDSVRSGTRVTFLSACLTAVYEAREMADEVWALTVGFLAGGSVSVIGTLWPVSDFATALVASRFYDLHLGEDTRLPPRRALREAQLWLRNLTGEEEDRYVSAHPSLLIRQQELKRSDPLVTRGARIGTKPYSSPTYWAPFVIYGV